MKKLKSYSILFLFLSLLWSCNDDDNTVNDDDMGNQNDPGSTNFDFFINFTADGETYSFGYNEANPDFDFLPGMSYTDLFENTNCFRTCGSGIITNNDNPNPQAGVDFYRFLDAFCTSSDPSVFNTLFPTGQYSYAAIEEENGVGFSFSPAPPNDNFYLSVGGGQSGSSSFSITSSTEDNIPSPIGTSYTQIITGTFNCTVYNEDDVNDSIEITAGSFRLRVISSDW